MPPCDVVLFSLFRTDNAYSSISLSMAKVLAEQGRVFYLNHPYSWKDLLTGLLRGEAGVKKRFWGQLFGRMQYETVPGMPAGLVAIQPPPTWPINWLPPGRLYDWLQRRNNAVIVRCIRRVLRENAVKKYVYLNCYDPFYAGFLPPDMGAVCSVYHCIDDITQDPYTMRHGAALEEAAIRGADVTLVTSSNLFRLKKGFARRIEAFYNAADATVFGKVRTEQYARPAELAGRSGPVIGFIGNLDALRIDYALLKKTAERYPGATLLLVGPVNSATPAAIGLDRMPNVVMAGSRALADLPPLLQHMDCVLIPFLCNTLTESIYPLKINEYLAAGKPAVSTNFSDDIRGFADCIYIAGEEADFLRQVGEALAERDEALAARRAAVAERNTWPARVEQFWEIVRQHSLCAETPCAPKLQFRQKT